MKKSLLVTMVIFTMACTAAIVKCQPGDCSLEPVQPVDIDPAVLQNGYSFTNLAGYAVLVKY